MAIEEGEDKGMEIKNKMIYNEKMLEINNNKENEKN